MKTVLAISPHLDDAVFSAGAQLSRMADDGWRVVIATCFTASVQNPTGFALACQLDKGLGPKIDYMELRRNEDCNACHIIGAEPLHLPFTEAPHRSYEDAHALFGTVNVNDQVIGPLTNALADLIEATSPDVVLAPAAIGNHVDHVIVRRVIEEIVPKCIFWADMPYANRTEFGQTGYTPFLCGDYSERKMDAALAYASQIVFQFCEAHASAALAVANAEWFQGPSATLAILQNTCPPLWR